MVKCDREMKDSSKKSSLEEVVMSEGLEKDYVFVSNVLD